MAMNYDALEAALYATDTRQTQDLEKFQALVDPHEYVHLFQAAHLLIQIYELLYADGEDTEWSPDTMEQLKSLLPYEDLVVMNIK